MYAHQRAMTLLKVSLPTNWYPLLIGQNHWVKIDFLEILGIYSISRLIHGVCPIM